MKFFYKLSFTVIAVLMVSAMNAQSNFFTNAGKNTRLQTTEKRVTIPESYQASTLNVAAMKSFLGSLPSEQSILYRRNQAPILTLPMPDGSMARFRVWESSIQEPELQAKFPEIRTYAGQGIDDPYATIRFDFNPYFGFSAQILSPNGRIYIDPYARRDVNNYMSYYQRDNKRDAKFECKVPDVPTTEEIMTEAGPCRGTQLRSYRLAVAVTGEYAQVVSGVTSGPGLAGPTHAAIVASVNRVSGVYEVEVAVRLILVANNNLIEFLDPATDPFFNDGDDDLDLITPNINSRVGSANYDVGHLFCTNESGGVGAGVAYVGVVCGATKGGGLTGRSNPTGDGYDIDYVAHELGHQFNARHTFNTNTCFSPGGSYEPGGGTTIMAYAGICGNTENIQPNSDPVFHAFSFDQISTFVSTGNGSNCGTVSATGNTLPVIDALPNNGISIPIGTPFVLNATASDADGDAITYNWEGWDVGAAGSWPSAATSTTRPLFRTRLSKTNGTRTFPDIRVIAANYPGTAAPSAMDGLRGETLATVARAMKFRLTVRDNRAGGGGVVSAGDGCQSTAIFQVNTVGSTPFAVTAPNGGESWAGGSTQTITWNNAGTTAAPFNVANVRITMSVDGGLTYPHELSASTANDGSEALAIPALATTTTTCRIRVEALGNIFFDISNTNFTVSAVSNSFDFTSPAPATATCPAPADMDITLGTTVIGTFSTTINLAATGAPAGTTVSFLPANTVTPGNNVTVRLSGANTLAPGSYVITVTGTAGAVVRTRQLTYTVNAGAGPAITANPASQTVCQGANVSFAIASATATGFQWQVNTGSGFNNIPVGAPYAGINTNTLIITGATAAMNTYQYRCIATAQCGSSTSTAGTLTVNVPPSISAHPQTVTQCAGTDNTFSVTAAGTGITYQWQVSTPAVPAFTNIPSATSSSYTVTGITAGMNGNQYRVIVSGTCTPAATSNPATLNVVTSVTVTTQPANATVCDGGTASFTAAGSGSGIIYQWQVNTGSGFVNVPAAAPYSGTTSATLTITGATVSMNGYLYRVQMSNSTCTSPGVSNSATLTVNNLPSISAQPQSATICVGSNNTFSVTAAGTGITYQWQISTPAVPAFTNIPAATSATYTVTGATAAMNNNQYRVIVSGTCPSPATSNAATLTVISPVTVTTEPVATAVCSGSNTSFTVAGNSSQPINYQWQVNNGTGFVNVANAAPYSGATTATLTITNAAVGLNNNQYRVQLSNATCTAATNSAAVVLTVRQLPTVGLTAAPLTSLLPGQTTTLTATPSASAGGTLTTTWFFNGSAITNAGNTRIVNVEQVGAYQVKIQEAFAAPPTAITCANESAIVNITAPASSRLFVFPTPNNGNFTVSYYNNGGVTTRRTIVIFDSRGAQVYNREFPVTGPYTLIPINLERAGTGIYYIVVGDATGQKLAEGRAHIR